MNNSNSNKDLPKPEEELSMECQPSIHLNKVGLQDTSNLSEAIIPVNIHVTDPRVEGDVVNRYVLYTISGEDNEGKLNTKKRYSDFVKIRSLLVHRWPGCYVPSLPPKKSLNNMTLEFVERRRRLLEGFCLKIAEINFLHYSAEYQLFLRSGKEDLEKTLQKFQIESPKDTMTRYQGYFNYLQEKEVNSETITKIAGFKDFLKGSIECFKNFKQISKEVIKARKEFYERFAELHKLACLDYEKNILSKYHENKPTVSVFNNPQNAGLNERVEKVKESAKDDSFERLCDWIKYEKYEILAFLEAINQREQYEALKNKAQEKQTLLIHELQNVKSGKGGLKMLISRKSKEEEISLAQAQLDECNKEVDTLTWLHNMITLLLAESEIDKFKVGKREKYYKILKAVSAHEKSTFSEMINYWKDITESENLKKVQPTEIKMKSFTDLSPKRKDSPRKAI